MQYGKLVQTLKIACALLWAVMLTAGAWGQQYGVQYSFPGGVGGWGVANNLVADAAGNLYGAAAYGGNSGCSGGNGCGIVYKLSLSQGTWTETVLYTFTGGSDGAEPSSGVILGHAGKLYGETYYGGDQSGLPGCGTTGCGLVFELSPTKHGWKEKVLHAFKSYNYTTGKQDGSNPMGGLTFDKAGNLYGVTAQPTNYGSGTVFELSRSRHGWKETPIYVFKGGSDGANPEGGVIFDASGNLYGTTLQGGSASNCGQPGGCGAVFMLSPGSVWTETTLYSFNNESSDGYFPDSGLVRDSKGNLYGATYYGGNMSDCSFSGCGAVFEVTPSGNNWTESILYAFTGGSDGATPRGGLVLRNGRLYGTAYQGGDQCPSGFTCGVVYDLTESNGNWAETVLHSFTGAPDGWLPTSSLLLHKGAFYGTTYIGGNGGGNCGAGYGCGTVFKLIP